MITAGLLGGGGGLLGGGGGGALGIHTFDLDNATFGGLFGSGGPCLNRAASPGPILWEARFGLLYEGGGIGA